MYRDFMFWCRENHVAPISKITFNREFTKYAISAVPSYSYDTSCARRKKEWLNVRLKKRDEKKGKEVSKKKKKSTATYDQKL